MTTVASRDPNPSPSQPRASRAWITWLLSIVGGAGFLWLASLRLRLWPDTIEVAAPALLWLAIAVHPPYAIIRAMRLQYVFDPLVVEASAGAKPRLDRRVLYGSGFVSFLVLMVLPLKLGEVSRPLLLERGKQPGLGVPESVTGVALERLVDGLLIVGMLFGGLALRPPAPQADVGDLRTIGLSLTAVFVVGLLTLVLAARDPARAGAVALRLCGPLGDRFASRLARIVERFAGGMKGVLDLRQAFHFVAWSVAYWGITVGQLWLVLHATGLPLSIPEAAVIVAVVGLSIQLPGGPAQAGTFQVGTVLALGLFVDATAVAGAGSSFAAVMYMLQLGGAAVMAIPGVALMSSARKRAAAAEPSGTARPP